MRTKRRGKRPGGNRLRAGARSPPMMVPVERVRHDDRRSAVIGRPVIARPIERLGRDQGNGCIVDGRAGHYRDGAAGPDDAQTMRFCRRACGGCVRSHRSHRQNDLLHVRFFPLKSFPDREPRSTRKGYAPEVPPNVSDITLVEPNGAPHRHPGGDSNTAAIDAWMTVRAPRTDRCSNASRISQNAAKTRIKAAFTEILKVQFKPDLHHGRAWSAAQAPLRANACIALCAGATKLCLIAKQSPMAGVS